MPWMSRLLGPLSETISRVSERASAFAADQIDGADTIDPAAAPVTDLRKSRRFMGGSNARGIGSGATSQGSCQILYSAERRLKAFSRFTKFGFPLPPPRPRGAYKKIAFPI